MGRIERIIFTFEIMFCHFYLIFFLQCLILTSLFFAAVSDGYIMGQMSGMVMAQQSGNGDIPLNEDEISWIGKFIPL